MRMRRSGRSMSDRQSALRNHGFDGFTIRFIWDEITCEQFKDALRGSNYRRHVQSGVNAARYHPLPLNLKPRQPKGKNGPDDRNGFDEALRDAPATGPDKSAFECGHP